jgi:hypothetical protein
MVKELKCRTGETEDPAELVLISIETNDKWLAEWVSTEITPVDTPNDATLSASVCTVMPVVLPAVAAPIVKPLKVMVKGIFAAMPEIAVVITI